MSYGSLLATCLVFFPRSAMACNYNRRCDGGRLLLSRDPPEDHIVRARLRGQDNLAVCDGRNLKKMKILGERGRVWFSLSGLNASTEYRESNIPHSYPRHILPREWGRQVRRQHPTPIRWRWQAVSRAGPPCLTRPFEYARFGRQEELITETRFKYIYSGHRVISYAHVQRIWLRNVGTKNPIIHIRRWGAKTSSIGDALVKYANIPRPVTIMK